MQSDWFIFDSGLLVPKRTPKFAQGLAAGWSTASGSHSLGVGD